MPDNWWITATTLKTALVTTSEGVSLKYLEEQMTKWREESGLKQAEIARKMGITRQSLYKLRKNAEAAGIGTLAKYAHACGVKEPVIDLSKVR